jgi:hypothetical protein
MKNLSLILFILFFNCSKEVSYMKKALEYESLGKKNEAIYYYSLSLKENKEYFPANKSLGILLSKKVESQDVASHYLEVAYKEKKEEEILLRLVDLYLLHSQVDKYKQIKNEIPIDKKEFIEDVYSCLKNNEDSINSAKKISTNFQEKLNSFFYLSVAHCFSQNGYKEKQDEILDLYK